LQPLFNILLSFHARCFVLVGQKIINSQGLEFLSDLRRRISQMSDDVRDSAFLFQHLSALSQIYLTRSLFRTLLPTYPLRMSSSCPDINPPAKPPRDRKTPDSHPGRKPPRTITPQDGTPCCKCLPGPTLCVQEANG